MRLLSQKENADWKLPGICILLYSSVDESGNEILHSPIARLLHFRQRLLSRYRSAVSDSITKLSFASTQYFPANSLQSFSKNPFSILPLPAIFSAGFNRIATSINSLSKNGTRPSYPPCCKRDLLARKQSYKCNLLSLRTVSSWNACALGALWKYK